MLAQAFVKQLKTIKTSSPVTAIVQDKDSVTVKVGVGYQADYLVMAVPLRALAKIQITPGWTASTWRRSRAPTMAGATS